MNEPQIVYRVFDVMDELNSVSTPPATITIESIQRQAHRRQRRRRLLNGAIGCVLLCSAIIGATALFDIPNNGGAITVTSDDTNDTAPTTSVSATLDELAAWVDEHTQSGNRFVFPAFVTSDESVEPLVDTTLEIRIHTDTRELTEVVLVVSKPCSNVFAIGLLEPQANGIFTFARNAQPSIGPPTEFSLAEACDLPRPEEFLRSIDSGVQLLLEQNEITFSSTETGRLFRFVTSTG